MHITKPNRATHTYRQRLHAAPSKVFPLLCPVRETEWANGWLPELVISSSGVAERDGTFLTPDKLGTAIWYITRHEPERWFVEMFNQHKSLIAESPFQPKEGFGTAIVIAGRAGSRCKFFCPGPTFIARLKKGRVRPSAMVGDLLVFTREDLGRTLGRPLHRKI